jgi:CDP-diacylglycerol--serine O-phosphatidyltransferase
MKIKRGINLLPSLFTTGNIFCGFYAFIAVLEQEFYLAAWAIVIAIIFDALDGRIARLTNTTSEFGMHYDSLADIISFGIAPAFLVYVWKLKPFGRIGWMAAFLFLLCGALRLARFNAMPEDERSQHFVGLPTPGAAAVIATIVIFSEDGIFDSLNPFILVVFVYLLAFLMVSNLEYPAFKKLGIKKRVPFARFLFIVLTLYIFATIPRFALFFISFSFALLGPLGYLYKIAKEYWLSHKTNEPDDQKENP